MSATSRDYKVYKSRFEHRQKAKPPPEIFEYELRAIASKETYVARGKDLKSAIANYFETDLMRRISGISVFCRHGREWYSATRMETTIKVERIY